MKWRDRILAGEVPPGIAPERAAKLARYLPTAPIGSPPQAAGFTAEELAKLTDGLDDPTLIGNRIATITAMFGVPPCGDCKKRQKWLNRIHAWLRGDPLPQGPKPEPPPSRRAYISTQQLVTDTLALAAKLPPDLAAIVGVPRSGLLPASLLALHLHLPLFVLTTEGIHNPGHGWRLGSPPAGGPLLVVDDNQVTGRSITSARKLIARFAADRRVLFAVLYRPGNLAQWRPDFVGRELVPPLYLEWNLFNSIHTPSMACDFDGILCHDQASGGPVGKQFYLPKRCELPMIITGRPEGSRGNTMAWLQEHGVKVRELKMWPPDLPWKPDREIEVGGHQVQHVSAIKAHHYRESACSLYVESDPRQAREISLLAGKPVLCPAAGRVF